MTATLTTANAIFKENYSGTRLEFLTYKRRPFWGALKKVEGFGGKYKPIPIQYATVGGRSKTYSNSRSGRAGARYESFDLTTADDYQQFTLNTKALMASRGDANAFKTLIKAEGDSALSNLSESISRGLFGNAGASVGVIASGQGTATLTLTNLSDIVNFQVGDVIASSVADGTSGAVSANTATLTAVDRDAGTITAGVAFDADFDDADYLFHVGDFGVGFAGLSAWLPSSAPTGGDSFFGVDRSVDPQWLAGSRYVATALADSTIRGALINAGARVSVAGGEPDCIVVNPTDFSTLVLEAVGKTTHYKDVPMKGYGGKLGIKLGYNAITIMLPTGEAQVMADKHCPIGTAYMLDMSTWAFHSLGKAPFMFDADGNTYLRETDSDGITARFQVFGNLACSAPGRNARVDINNVN